MAEKAPDEIKKGLECCKHGDSCRFDCPYGREYSGIDDCTSNLSKDALALIQQLEAQVPKWISVEERLPEGEVLAANFAPSTYGYMEYIIGHVFAARPTEPGGCYAESEHEILHDVTHWMSLPEPPKEEA